MQWLTWDKISSFILSLVGGFAKIFLGCFLLWMVGLVGIFIYEAFQKAPFSARLYFKRVWKMWALSFRWGSYSSIPASLLVLWFSHERLPAVLLLIDACILTYALFRWEQRYRKRKKERLPDATPFPSIVEPLPPESSTPTAAPIPPRKGIPPRKQRLSDPAPRRNNWFR